MSSYIPLFNNRTNSRHQSSSVHGADFGAFDDPSDGEEDAHVLPSMQSGRTSPARGARSLGGGSSDDSLSLEGQHQRRSGGGRASPQSVPGAYDFEPQANEGGPPPSIQHRTRPTPARTSPHSPPAAARNAWNPLSLTERFLPATVYSRLVGTAPVDRESSARLLFSQDEEDADVEGAARPTYPPHGTASLIPLPPRPLPGLHSVSQSTRVFGGGQGNDGVFANLSAKPDGLRRGEGEYVGGDDSGGGDKDEVPPSYEAAALDSTPPYWETTVITPQGFLGPDDICVDGLPVGNLFGFAWNLLVSMSFQFVGFLLTYLLHTTHAAKNGSRAGLGITLIQLGLYIKDRPPPALINITDNTGANPFGSVATSTLTALGSIPTQLHGALSGALDASDPDSIPMPSLGDFSGEEVVRMSEAANEWMAFMLVTVGSFLVIGGCLSYWRAVRWARAVRRGMDNPTDVEVIVE